MITKKLICSAACAALLACNVSSGDGTANVAHNPAPSKQAVTVMRTYWTMPRVEVTLVQCERYLADCFVKAGSLCKERGFLAEQVDDHDIIFMCKPKPQDDQQVDPSDDDEHEQPKDTKKQ